ncbi:MAG: DUF3300 domain-containing protein [Nibricoccus sp.]
MKHILRLLLLMSVGVFLPTFAFADSDDPKLSPEEMEKLVSPIALYPDSLVALILPASTDSSDVVRAARFFAGGGDQSDISKQFWSDSVKSLAHYPDVIKWMDENLEWTQQMGEAFVAQPTDVMNAIQRLRVHAKENGLLQDTPQQKVVVEHEVVYIQPAEPTYIYIPRYDPEILWMRRSIPGAFISFSIGFSTGNWLFYDCDWSGRAIYVHRRTPSWVYHPGWRPPPPAVRVNVVQEWHPHPRHIHRPEYSVIHPRPPVVMPRPPFVGSPVHPVGPLHPVGPVHPVSPMRPTEVRRGPMPGEQPFPNHRSGPPTRVYAPPPSVPSAPPPGPARFEHRRPENAPRVAPRPAPPAPTAPQPSVQPGPAAPVAPAPNAPTRQPPPGRTFSPAPQQTSDGNSNNDNTNATPGGHMMRRGR